MEPASQYKISIVELIKERMTDLQCNAEKLSALSGVPKSSISRLLSPKHIQIKIESLDKVLGCLGLFRDIETDESPVQIAHVGLIPKFKNKPLAKQINEALLEIEKIRPSELLVIYGQLQGKLEMIERDKGHDDHPIVKKTLSNSK